MSPPVHPSPELLAQQSDWLAPARARLLRRAEIARRRRVLDLACGPGTVVAELVERSGGSVVALDCSRSALAGRPERLAGAAPVCGRAERLPFADGAFDLVFCQFALLWLDAAAAVREARRVLSPGGVLAAIEPDYGGLIEHPAEIAAGEIWRAALARAGADPCVGRKLPALLAAAGFGVRVDLLDRLTPPSPVRFDLLAGLPLTDSEKAALERIRRIDAAMGGSPRVVHLPMFLITAEAPSSM
jgi:SAM-dependent methyltransferase